MRFCSVSRALNSIPVFDHQSKFFRLFSLPSDCRAISTFVFSRAFNSIPVFYVRSTISKSSLLTCLPLLPLAINLQFSAEPLIIARPIRVFPDGANFSANNLNYRSASQHKRGIDARLAPDFANQPVAVLESVWSDPLPQRRRVGCQDGRHHSQQSLQIKTP